MTIEFKSPFIQASKDLYQSYTFDVDRLTCYPGNNRTRAKWDALKDVFPKIVRDRTFMDIGAAQGFFCFKALDLCATHVIGVEKRESYWRSVEEALNAANRSRLLPLSMEYLCLSFPGATKHLEAEVVMALSLSHHLARNGMYFGQQLDKFAQLTKRTLLIEFIAPEDAQVDFCYSWYSQEVFEKAGRDRFRAIERIGHGHHPTRHIYRMDK